MSGHSTPSFNALRHEENTHDDTEAIMNGDSHIRHRWRMVFVPILLLSVLNSCENKIAEDERPIVETVNQFFAALAGKDSAAAKAVMMPQGRFYSIREDGSIRTQTHAEFFEAIAVEETDFVERMWNPTVLVHGRIAVLWTPYDFHRNGQFSHCGVDAFSLIQTDEGWKIAGTIYTVQRDGCTESPLGPPE